MFTLYASNLRETSFGDAAFALAAVLGLALFLLAAFGAALRGFSPRAAILASIVLCGILLYADLLSGIRRIGAGAISASLAVAILLGFGALLIVTVWRSRSRLALPNAVLNGVAFVLCIVPAWKAASYEWRTWRMQPILEEPLAGSERAVAPAARPDVYYIIFDRYASQPVLARNFGFDNRPLMQSLERQGFYVAGRSHSNYLKTAPSLASTFHMDYINFLADTERAQRKDWHPIYDMLDDHRVARLMKSLGYRFIQLGGWWGPTQHNSYADENYSFGFTEFNWLYLRRTILPPLLHATLPGNSYSRRMQGDNGQCRRIPAQFEKLREIAGRAESTFVFAHLLLPHEPFIFDAQGHCMSPPQMRTRDFKTGYVGQLEYANRLIADFVADVLAVEGDRPIVIIQADEGPFPQRYRSGSLSWRAATPPELRMKTGILNAYYFPDGDYAALHDDITPVNSFRIVFNQYFGTGFPLLPDRIYAMPDVFDLYDFYDITPTVREEPD